MKKKGEESMSSEEKREYYVVEVLAGAWLGNITTMLERLEKFKNELWGLKNENYARGWIYSFLQKPEDISQQLWIIIRDVLREKADEILAEVTKRYTEAVNLYTEEVQQQLDKVLRKEE